MIKSMTAFASSESEVGMYTITCEIRSVNHRYCDLFFKLPETLKFAESELRKIISTQIKRGKVECGFILKNEQNPQANILVDEQAVQTVLQATATIEQHMQHAVAFSALDILAFPGVQKEADIDKQDLLDGILKLLDQTLQQFISQRTREGGELSQVIHDRCIKIQKQLELAKTRIPEVLDGLREKILSRITELEIDPDYDRLEQELVYQTQKLDIDEEIDRLQAHLNEVLRILNIKEPVGRRLDFLMQEMNREANTIGSKSLDKQMTAVSIELKVLIEQMREQIQNIE